MRKETPDTKGKTEIRTERDPQRVKPMTFCRRCLGEIYPGQDYYETERGIICTACLEKYAGSYFAPLLHRGAEQEVDA